MRKQQRPSLVLASLGALFSLLSIVHGLAFEPLNRRDALLGTAAAAASGLSPPASATDTIDMDAINAAREKKSVLKAQPELLDMEKINAVRSPTSQSVVPITDPPPLLTIRGGKKGEQSIKIPRVGYSFYKTEPEKAARCTALALRTGVRHLDVGALYGSNSEISKPLKKYLDTGLSGLDFSQEKPELLELLDATSAAGSSSGGMQSSFAPPPDGSAGRRGRRAGLFIHHKVSNAQMSAGNIGKAVKAGIAELGCTYLDMVSIHSPLVSSNVRLSTYETLLELRNAGFVKSVGVCNYGLGPLQEIQAAGLELPSMNQLELSPFNAHKNIVNWCSDNGVAIGCSAWSKLSSTPGLQDGWDVVGSIAKNKGMTKAQVLVRWSLQKGYVCVPRSASTSKIERIAIAENSYGGVNRPEGQSILTAEEMKILDGLDVSWKAGSLGRRDGWDDSDVTGADWDPTDVV